jgi:PTH1 family peptidyl-tRNA hydrolase
MVVDAFASQHRAPWVRERKWDCSMAKLADGWLLKPLTYMNLSGQAVAAAAKFYKVQPQEVLAVYDDVDLALGRLRLRPHGGAGGHNGMRSLIAHLGGNLFPRLKIGIGFANNSRPDGKHLSDHVLGRFDEAEQIPVQHAITRAVDAINTILTRGFEAAMNTFNQTDQPTTPNP